VGAPEIFALSAFGLCLIVSAYLLIELVASGGPGDPSERRGSPAVGIVYSLTAAMMPWKKESARLHVPIYAAGVAYHLGTFAALVWWGAVAVGATAAVPVSLLGAASVMLAATAVCGAALLARRLGDRALRHFSSADDYFSNALATGFQALASLSLVRPSAEPVFLIWTGLLLIYLPFGKLRHAIYFLPARIFLGAFYGKRGVWPAAGRRRWED
jgi:hypothetical protein